MADTPIIPGSEDPALSKVTINGQEYDASEAEELINVGRQTREAEAKYNTTFDKVWPEYGKTQTLNKQLQTERDEARAELEKFSAKQEAGTETNVDVQKAKEAARALGLSFNEDLEKAGYIRKEDLPKYLEEHQAQQDEVNKLLATADKLEGEINGSDGRPAFVKKQVLAYANAYGFDDLTKAYEDMFSSQLDSWKKDQVAAGKQPGLKTLDANGAKKEPERTKVTDDNVKDLLKEVIVSGNN